jgi:iron complex transport system substrate-binding protein
VRCAAETTVCTFLLIVATTSLLPAQPSASTVRYPLTDKDDSGTSITLLGEPRRIISLTLPTDEILLCLTDSSRILAVTTLAVDPGISNVSVQARQVPRAMTLSVEPIVALRPDLVFAASWSDPGAIGQLRSAGVPVFLMNSATSVAAVEENIARCAFLTGEPEKGAQMIAHMKAEISTVQKAVGAISEEKRPRVLDFTTFGASMGKGSSWDDIVRLAGLVNAVGGIASDEWGQVPISTEKLLQIDPDIIVLPGWVYRDPRGAETFRTRVMRDPTLSGLSAVKTGRVYMMPERLRTCTSQFIADAVEWLARVAYPSLF